MQLSKDLRRPVVAMILPHDGSRPERFQYENGRLTSRLS
jgi:hypothetical protein